MLLSLLWAVYRYVASIYHKANEGTDSAWYGKR